VSCSKKLQYFPMILVLMHVPYDNSLIVIFAKFLLHYFHNYTGLLASRLQIGCPTCIYSKQQFDLNTMNSSQPYSYYPPPPPPYHSASPYYGTPYHPHNHYYGPEQPYTLHNAGSSLESETSPPRSLPNVYISRDMRQQYPPAEVVAYPYSEPPVYPPYYCSSYHAHWPPVEYITDIHPQDVLSGRGGATNSHAGNRAFRALVKEYQAQYLKAKKRDKPAVASLVVEVVRSKGGRFLRRCDSMSTPGPVMWVDIGDERAREKTCQALREGAPELRRQKQQGSHPAEKSSGSCTSSCSATSLAVERRQDSNDTEESTTRSGLQVAKYKVEYKITSPKKGLTDGPIWIRPSSRLLPCRHPKPMALDELDEDDRALYLRDFLPPGPTIQQRSPDYWQGSEDATYR
jgi:hypothetical protein